MLNLYENSMLYTAVEAQRAVLKPLSMWLGTASKLHAHPSNPWAYTSAGRSVMATYTLMERMTRHYTQPDFGIESTKVEGKAVKISEEVLLSKSFCHLKQFKKASNVGKQQKLLIVAPMSGHFATLLRGTVEATLPFYDVYITEWINASEVPVHEGKFDLDDFIDYCIEFMEFLGPDVHVMAVCQPSVPVLAAVSLMGADKNKKAPRSMILIGGPIDTRKSPTELNNFAAERSIEWFERNLITRVPFNYSGRGRRVYPGFLQLMGFMAMNMQRHIGEHMKLFQHLVEGDGESTQAHEKFYNEYLAVMDLPAEFYLQTVRTVFQEYALPQGKMTSRGHPIDPGQITKTALLAIEGELDDISGVGQTKAALRLCRNLPEDKKHYHLQAGVGHYGSFNGRKFREHIMPVIREFTERNG